MTETTEDRGPSSFLDSLGTRGRRRAEPRSSIAIAGAGCALGILGALVIAADTGLDESSGDFNRWPGVLLCALIVGAGFFLLASTEGGPIATAGSVAAAVAVPPLMFFATFDQNSLPPYSSEVILIVSTGVWLVAYLVGPGRGRPFFLGAGLLALWLTALQLIENLFDAPFDAIASFSEASGSFDTAGSFDSGPTLTAPDASTIGVISLGFAVAYLLLGRALDKVGRHGIATPFALAALPCLAVGIGALSPDLEQAGTGLLLILVGLVLTLHGASVWRRFTTWLGGAVTALGAAVFLGDMTDDATVAGMLFLAAGIALVFAGHAIAAALREPDEMDVTMPPVPISVPASAAAPGPGAFDPAPADQAPAHAVPPVPPPVPPPPPRPEPETQPPVPPPPVAPEEATSAPDSDDDAGRAGPIPPPPPPPPPIPETHPPAPPEAEESTPAQDSDDDADGADPIPPPPPPVPPPPAAPHAPGSTTDEEPPDQPPS